MTTTLGFDTVTFSKNISEILDYEYGDFMRAANVQLNQLRYELQILHDKNINHRIDLMQIYLQFIPDCDVELTRKKLSSDIQFLDDILHGHDQDWESASSTFNFLNEKPAISFSF